VAAVAIPDALWWPAAIGVVLIVAILVFHGPLTRLLDRIKGIGIGKTDVTFGRPSQDEATVETPQLKSYEEFMRLPLSPTQLAREERFRRTLDSMKLNSDAEKVGVLIRTNAISQVSMEFQSVSNLIFGSQLNLLARLVGTPAGLSDSIAGQIYQEGVANFPEIHATRKFDEWLQYLIHAGLITRTPERIDITQCGQDFLKYLVDARLAYPRQG